MPTIYTCIDTIGVVIYIKAKMVWQQALSSKIHPSPWLTTGNSKVWFVCFNIQTINIPFSISDICTPPPQLSGFSLQWYKPCTLTLTLTALVIWVTRHKSFVGVMFEEHSAECKGSFRRNYYLKNVNLILTLSCLKI